MGETDVDRPNGTSSSDDSWDASRYVGTPQYPPQYPQFTSRDGRGLVVHPYDDADRDALAEVCRDYNPDARSMGLPSTNEAHTTEWLSNLVDRGHNFVTVADQGIVGHAAYVANDDPEPELAVFVRQDSRDHGIGTELCRHIVADTADARRGAFVLHAAPDNRRTIHVYRELGFETISSNDADMKTYLDLTPSVPSTTRPTTGTGNRG